jgi:hypothetical protein
MDGRLILEWILKKLVGGFGLDSYGSGRVPEKVGSYLSS